MCLIAKPNIIGIIWGINHLHARFGTKYTCITENKLLLAFRYTGGLRRID